MNETNFSVSGMNNQQDPLAAFFNTNEVIVFPHSLTPLVVGTSENIEAVNYAMDNDRLMVLFHELPKDDVLQETAPEASFSFFMFNGDRLSAIGTLVRIVKRLTFPDGTMRIVVRGLKRVTCTSIITDDVVKMRYTPLIENVAENKDTDLRGAQDAVVNGFRKLSSFSSSYNDDNVNAVSSATTPSRCADLLADILNISFVEKLVVLIHPKVKDRLALLSIWINREKEISRVGMKIQTLVHESMSQQQREYFLKEQIKTIKKELGEDTRNPDLIELDKRRKSVKVPDYVDAVIERELGRLEMIPTASPEYHIYYLYLNWLLDIPWYVSSEDNLDCKVAEKILERDHFGLQDVKKRILEFLSVMQLRGDNPDKKAPILCLIGPPGVGKTSLGQSIAEAMNRKFIRFSLGGMRDEAEIRGHRRTYVGAMPGRIVQNLKRIGTNNPVFMLDEIDKLAHDFRGDPAAAMLEVLDPEQNVSFNDNYLEVGLDLSKIFFIATANQEENIPGPLRDRMEIIRLSGYTAIEKHQIAKKYIVPRQIKACGLKSKLVKFKASALEEVITYYTMEAGVRTLEQVIGRVCRRIAQKVVAGEIAIDEEVKVDSKMVQELLGPRKYIPDSESDAPIPGRAVGMAWNGAGGAILPIEVTMLPGGKGNLKLTGSLGKVMTESAEIAFSLVRSKSKELGIDSNVFTENDFHIHVPDGSTPKDGPSAGVTLTMALISLLTNKPLRKQLSMTGEITLHGKVTAVGGIREKCVSALRAGIRKIMMPEQNRKDYYELPDEVKDKVEFHFVNNYQEAMAFAFGDK